MTPCASNDRCRRVLAGCLGHAGKQHIFINAIIVFVVILILIIVILGGSSGAFL